MDTENKLVKKLQETGSQLVVQLCDPRALDLSVFDVMAADENALSALLLDQAAGTLQYQLEGMVSLETFLDQYTFENEEGYLFLGMLFETAIACNRNKPVLFYPDYIYVSPYGERVKFIVLPLAVESWMYQADALHFWIDYLCSHFKTTTAYEIIGYMIRLKSAPEFSLPALVSGLSMLKAQYHPGKWYKPSLKRFVLREPVRPVQEAVPPAAFSSPAQEIQDPEQERKQAAEKFLDMEEATQIIGSVQESSARLEGNGDVYSLLFDDMLVGRGMQCQIRLQDPSVSIRHARISRVEDRYYIQDLKSSNHTWLNDKLVQRKMRLKPGMVVRFGAAEMVFSQ